MSKNKNKTEVSTEPVKVQTKITVTQKLSIGTMRIYFVVEMNDTVVFVLNDASVSRLVLNYIDGDQLVQMWSDIDQRSMAVINKVG